MDEPSVLVGLRREGCSKQREQHAQRPGDGNNVVMEEMQAGQYELASRISKSTQYRFFN